MSHPSYQDTRWYNRLPQEQQTAFDALMKLDRPASDPHYKADLLERIRYVKAALREFEVYLEEDKSPFVERAVPSIIGAFFSPIDKRVIVLSAQAENAVASADVPLSLDVTDEINLAVISWYRFVQEKKTGTPTEYHIPPSQRDLYEEIYASGKPPVFTVLERGDMTRTQRRDGRTAHLERLVADGHVLGSVDWN